MKLLSITEAAAELGIGKRTVEKLLHEARLRPVRIGRRVLLAPDELDRFVRVCTAPATTAAGPVSKGQTVALHARADQLDRLAGYPRGTSKTAIKEWAVEAFGRTIESTKDLTYDEASAALDELADRIAAAGQQC